MIMIKIKTMTVMIIIIKITEIIMEAMMMMSMIMG
ncbi:unnamed protein product [Protopolystoma xenopodis]|uniref:Uncharacterized protein n=1 Tax=Protopolystoma xenopodis TaxID=117903 RepID=A0A448WQX5_9PLAT|nr:unnamed protein product [Protopolystoma xenopodis]